MAELLLLPLVLCWLLPCALWLKALLHLLLLVLPVVVLWYNLLLLLA